jgi:transposase-like protein
MALKHWLEPDSLAQIEAWAREGLIMVEIAERIGIHRDTLYRWCRKSPVLRDAVERGRADANTRVEESLFKRAVGYTYTTTKTVACYGDEGEASRSVTTEERHTAPDVTACIFWLKNRRPDRWRDGQNVELDGNLSFVQIIDDIPK